MQNADIKTISTNSPLWPEEFNHLRPPPKILYYKGDITLSGGNKLSVVGSRKYTSYGKQVTQELVTRAVRGNYTIVSGLAYGIDSIAHKACLEAGGKTIAVLPCSIDTIYPSPHHALAKDILRNGGLLLSEYAPGLPSQAYMCVARNRLIAALTTAYVLVPEARINSGCRHTVRAAQENVGKSVIAIPGTIYMPQSAYPNMLIASGAHAIAEYVDFDSLLGIDAHPLTTHLNTPQTIDQLVILANKPATILKQQLTLMEIEGIVRQNPDTTWQLLAKDTKTK